MTHSTSPRLLCQPNVQLNGLYQHTGLPTGVARRMMSGGATLVGRIVSTAAESALAARDGANFVVLQVGFWDRTLKIVLLPSFLPVLAFRVLQIQTFWWLDTHETSYNEPSSMCVRRQKATACRPRRTAQQQSSSSGAPAYQSLSQCRMAAAAASPPRSCWPLASMAYRRSLTAWQTLQRRRAAQTVGTAACAPSWVRRTLQPA